MIPDLAIALVAGLGGFSAKPSLCPAGKWTIGYGTLCRPAHPPVTAAEAPALARRVPPARRAGRACAGAGA